MMSNYKLQLTVLLLSTLTIHNTIGFDLYSHSIAFSSSSAVATLYRSYQLFSTSFPRYLLLSEIYLSLNQAHIPLGLAIIVITSIPNFFILKSFVRNSSNKYTISFLALLSLCLICNFFYSALSVATLWLSALLITRKKIFILGGFFHPLSLPLLIIISLLTKTNRLLTFTLILLYIIYRIAKSKLNLSGASIENIIYINYISVDYVVYTVSSKIKELLLLFSTILILRLAMVLKPYSIRSSNILNLTLNTVLLAHLSLAVYTMEKYTAIYSRGELAATRIIECTWLYTSYCDYRDLIVKRDMIRDLAR